MKLIAFICAVAALTLAIVVAAQDSRFSTNLHAKFQAGACVNCHDFFEESRKGMAFGSHLGRSPDSCVLCHTAEVTGFAHADEWFAQPGLYTSGMDATETCEATKAALHAKFKNESLLARQLEHHLFEDPRVLWGIAGATPKSGMLPDGAMQPDLIAGGMERWRAQVKAWIDGGMRCD